ncbi:hypothetical protein TL16_g03392 [Triparma laevis f. inornata]|uniref:Uncharacterized protein n=1 Tax=Triparma laevis f. inornata TaxID=1714386 RepID=A0A9W7A630_9STRA|nr:hypothetical protein TL16_g03392 [Triparma laevis f. inornata]
MSHTLFRVAGTAASRPFFTRSLSTRADLKWEEKIMSALSQVRDPVTNRSIRALGYIQSISPSAVQVELPSPFHPNRLELVKDMTACLQEAANPAPKLKVSYAERGHDANSDTAPLRGPGLEHVQRIMAVYSCKGGVGKSTVATNLAFALSRQGLRVGLLDCDVYGPSLPTLVRPVDITVKRSEIGKMVCPIEHEGVKLLSLGYVSSKSGVPGAGSATSSGGNDPAVIRGPMASRVVTQLLKGTEWGELDVLLLDLPPGTGDVQLTICQEIVIEGAVAVTTPGSLAKADVLKGIEMFETLNIPTICAVENMSYFRNPVNDEKHYLLGTPISHEEMSLESEADLVRIPMSEAVSKANDDGVPVALLGTAEEASAYEELAAILTRRLFDRDICPSSQPSDPSESELEASPSTVDSIDVNNVSLTYDHNRKSFVIRIFSEDGASESLADPEALRTVNPKTGELLEDTKKNTRMLAVKATERKGSYGYAVTWGNGATFIYSMKVILNLVKNNK